jgi:hypothetical protein
MLPQATKDKLKNTYHLDIDKLIEAIKAEAETDFEVPEVTVFTQDEITSRDEQKLSEGKKEGQKAGENIGKEIAVKEMKRSFGVEFEGKDLTKLVETVKTQLAKGDEGLKEQVKLLQRNLEEKETALVEKDKAAQAAMFDAELLSELPANRFNLISDKEQLSLIKGSVEFSEDGVKFNGQILRDPKTQNPLPRKQALEQIYAEKKWVNQDVPVPGGRGGGNTPPVLKPTKTSEVKTQWQKEHPELGFATAEFQQHLMTIAKEVGKDFEFDNN